MSRRTKAARAIKSALDALAAVLVPAPCRICERPLTSASRIPICQDCLDSFEPIRDPMCDCCGRPFASALAGQAAQPRCRLCRAEFYSFDLARSFARYGDALMAAVLLLKYEQVTRLGEWFAARLACALGRHAATGFDAVVAVPLHSDRQRERGYNQADLIAKPLARRLGRRFAPGVLVRTRPRPPQLVLSRAEHWKSVRGAYAIREGAQVDNLRILLVDDVLTTGATLDACSRALKKAGAREVVGITVGRVVPDAWRRANPDSGPARSDFAKPGAGREHLSTGESFRQEGGPDE